MNKEDLGKYYIKNDEKYQVIGYVDEPALILKNIKTNQKEIIVIGCPLSKEYKKLDKVGEIDE